MDMETLDMQMGGGGEGRGRVDAQQELGGERALSVPQTGAEIPRARTVGTD